MRDTNPNAAVPPSLGRYRITGTLGSGAMGIVYRAHDPLIDRAVAVKLMRTDAIEAEQRAEFLERFLQEVRAAARCAHPAIVTVHDFGGDPDGSTEHAAPFIVMELVEGGSLAALSKVPAGRAKLSPSFILLPVLDALGAVHAVGVVHRDLKPANILVTPSGHPKITDFGIARLRAGAAATGLTQAGSLVGTPSYMAPEQARGETVDHRADLFSAGCILYEMLVGQTPFGAPSVAETILRLADPEPAKLEPIAAAAPHYLPVLQRALAKAPADRFASAADFAAAVRIAAETSASMEETMLRPLSETTLGYRSVIPAATPEIDPALLTTYGDELAKYLGPIASTLVRRAAAAQGGDRDAVCQTLASHLKRPADRAAFLQRCGAADRTFDGVTTRRSRTDHRSIAPESLSAEAVDAAQRLLADRFGPIATLMVRKAAATSTGPEAFVTALTAQAPIERGTLKKLCAALGIAPRG